MAGLNEGPKAESVEGHPGVLQGPEVGGPARAESKECGRKQLWKEVSLRSSESYDK